MTDDQTLRQQVLRYYNKRESRWGYRILLGGTRHFGYYPKGQKHVSMRTAQRLMSDKVANALSLPPDSLVLDAGCGEGSVAIHLAKTYGFLVDGVDIISESIAFAQHKAKHHGVADRVQFKELDYSQLDAPSEHYDGLYTVETLVHAPDYRRALKEFYRVVAPGGRLVLLEYSMPELSSLSAELRTAFEEMNSRAAMHSLPHLTHGCFPRILADAGFTDVGVEDVTENVVPMMRRFAQIAYLPFLAIRAAGGQERFVNARSAVDGYRYREHFRYNIVTAIRK